MVATRRVLCALAVVIGVAGGSTARADDKKPEKPKPAAEPGKTIVIQIDASKLPPDVLKQLLQLSEKSKPASAQENPKPGTKPAGAPEKPKPGTKPAREPEKPKAGVKPGGEGTKPVVKSISLADAVAIAEKLTKGTATRAEKGKAQFVVEVQDVKGGKTEVAIGANGKVLGTEKHGEEKGEKKGDDEKGEKSKPKKREDEKGETGKPRNKS